MFVSYNLTDLHQISIIWFIYKNKLFFCRDYTLPKIWCPQFFYTIYSNMTEIEFEVLFLDDYNLHVMK